MKYEAIIAFLVAIISKPWQHPIKAVKIMVTTTSLVVHLNFEKCCILSMKFKRNSGIGKKILLCLKLPILKSFKI